MSRLMVLDGSFPQSTHDNAEPPPSNISDTYLEFIKRLLARFQFLHFQKIDWRARYTKEYLLKTTGCSNMKPISVTLLALLGFVNVAFAGIFNVTDLFVALPGPGVSISTSQAAME